MTKAQKNAIAACANLTTEQKWVKRRWANHLRRSYLVDVRSAEREGCLDAARLVEQTRAEWQAIYELLKAELDSPAQFELAI